MFNFTTSTCVHNILMFFIKFIYIFKVYNYMYAEKNY